MLPGSPDNKADFTRFSTEFWQLIDRAGSPETDQPADDLELKLETAYQSFVEDRYRECAEVLLKQWEKTGLLPDLENEYPHRMREYLSKEPRYLPVLVALAAGEIEPSEPPPPATRFEDDKLILYLSWQYALSRLVNPADLPGSPGEKQAEVGNFAALQLPSRDVGAVLTAGQSPAVNFPEISCTSLEFPEQQVALQVKLRWSSVDTFDLNLKLLNTGRADLRVLYSVRLLDQSGNNLLSEPLKLRAGGSKNLALAAPATLAALQGGLRFELAAG